MREAKRRYDDPVDLLWLHAAAQLGLRIERSDEVFASYDGHGTLTVCGEAHYDPDDSLAQLIFHELCHALVAGEGAMERPDWGMHNMDARDLVQEHACHRLQAALADRHGLRGLLGVTTDHRPYWDALPPDPLGPGADPAIPLAREAFGRATHGPWAKTLEAALSSTRRIAELVRECAPPESLWRATRALHPAGFPMPETPRGTCGSCAWSYPTARSLRCRQTKRPGKAGRAVRSELAGCARFEPELDAEACGRCGACCREAFDIVEVRRGERFSRKHPELVRQDGFGSHVPRPHGRCIALVGTGTDAPYRCQHYDDRPESCRHFEVAGDACLEARRKLGLSA